MIVAMSCAPVVRSSPARSRGDSMCRLLPVSLFLATALAAVSSVAGTDPTVDIIWNAPVTISGSTDVITSGSLVYAYNFGSSAALSGTTASINSVPFAPFAVSDNQTQVTNGPLTIRETAGQLFSNVDFTTNTGIFPSLPATYQFLLQSGVYANNPSNLEIDMGGLTTGQEYVVQWWSSAANPSTPILFGTTTAVSGSTQVSLDSRANGIGQYVVGSFTATRGTARFYLQTQNVGSPILLTGATVPLLNAIQIRAVPEPSTYGMALVAIGFGGWRLWRARRRGRPGRDAAAASAGIHPC